MQSLQFRRPHRFDLGQGFDACTFFLNWNRDNAHQRFWRRLSQQFDFLTGFQKKYKGDGSAGGQGGYQEEKVLPTAALELVSHVFRRIPRIHVRLQTSQSNGLVKIMFL